MDSFLAIVIVLLILAAADLIVGVSNDAANFLNSAIGSRVATPRRIAAPGELSVPEHLDPAQVASASVEAGRMSPEVFALPEPLVHVVLVAVPMEVVLLLLMVKPMLVQLVELV